MPSPIAPIAIKITVAIAPRTPEDVPGQESIVASRTASIPSTIASVMAINELATLLVHPAKHSPVSSLAQRVC
jgi:hypothetical protein